MNRIKTQHPVNEKSIEKLLTQGLLELSSSADHPDPTDERTAADNIKVRFFIALYQCIEKDLELIRLCGTLVEQPDVLKELHLQTGFPLDQLEQLGQLSHYLLFFNEPLEGDYVAAWSRYLRYLLGPSQYKSVDRKRDLERINRSLPSRKKLKRKVRNLEERLHHVTSMMVALALKRDEP